MGEPEEAGQRNAEQIVARLGALVEELEDYPDAELRDKAIEFVQSIMELYGEALRRTLAVVDSLPLKDQVLSRLLSDDVIRAMLLIHGLMPVDLESRVAAALDHVRPYLVSQGADVELVDVEGGRALLRLIRKGSGAPPIAVLQQEIERAISEAAPDLVGIEIEGLADQIRRTTEAASLLGSKAASRRSNGQNTQKLVQLKRQPTRPADSGGSWVAVIRANGIADGQFRIISFGEINLFVCRIGGEFYAYLNRCAAGSRTLDDALFESPMLTCTCHGYRYDLRREGACIEKPELRLESLPVKVEDEKVKVLVLDE